MVFRTAVIQASLGGIDNIAKHTPQTVPYDHFIYTDENLPPRDKALRPRLQAKIPKFFGWQLAPDHDYYLWLDGNIGLNKPETLEYLLKEIEGYDIVVLRHPVRPNIRQEVRYTRKSINQESIYALARYTGEQYQELYELIEGDKDYVDDLLVIGGIFLYKNTTEVQVMMKEWWYYNTRYCLQDQLSFAYVLKKSGLKVKILDHDFRKWDMIKINRHKINVA